MVRNTTIVSLVQKIKARLVSLAYKQNSDLSHLDILKIKAYLLMAQNFIS